MGANELKATKTEESLQTQIDKYQLKLGSLREVIENQNKAMEHNEDLLK